MPDVVDIYLVYAAAVTFAAGLIRGFTGFGSAMLMSPIFAILYGPATMVPLVVLIELGVSAQLMPGALRHADWRFVGPMAVAAAICMPIGGWLLLTVDAAVLTRVVALIVAVFAIVLMLGWRHRGRKRLPLTIGIGAVSGTMMATTSVGGPPVLLYMLSGQDNAARNRANIISYYAVTGVALLVVMAVADVVNARVLWLAALLLPLIFLGAHIGARFFRQTSEQRYRWISLSVILAVGLFGLLR